MSKILDFAGLIPVSLKNIVFIVLVAFAVFSGALYPSTGHRLGSVHVRFHISDLKW